MSDAIKSQSVYNDVWCIMVMRRFVLIFTNIEVFGDMLAEMEYNGHNCVSISV